MDCNLLDTPSRLPAISRDWDFRSVGGGTFSQIPSTSVIAVNLNIEGSAAFDTQNGLWDMTGNGAANNALVTGPIKDYFDNTFGEGSGPEGEAIEFFPV